MTTLEPTLTFDFRKTLEENRLKGLWKMMVDYRVPYIGATAALAISALAKTFTYMLLRYFADDVLTQGQDFHVSFVTLFCGQRVNTGKIHWKQSDTDLFVDRCRIYRPRALRR